MMGAVLKAAAMAGWAFLKKAGIVLAKGTVEAGKQMLKIGPAVKSASAKIGEVALKHGASEATASAFQKGIPIAIGLVASNAVEAAGNQAAAQLKRKAVLQPLGRAVHVASDLISDVMLVSFM